MIDYHATMVSALNTVLPTHYEMALTRGTQTPCISYMELSNSVRNQGDTMEYSGISFQIKVWGNDIAVIQEYAKQVDEVLRPLGWVRRSSAELYDVNSTMIQKVMTYEALALEIFNGGNN